MTTRNNSRRRHERKMGATGVATPEQVQARMDYFGNRCAYCGGDFEEVDHVIPLSRGGTGWASNYRPACKPCNGSKGDKLLGEWLGPTSLAGTP